MKTVLVRAYTYCNLGDDLFLKILVERYPEVQFRIIAPVSYEKIFKKYKNVVITQISNFSLLNRLMLKLIGFVSLQKKESILLNNSKKFYMKESGLSDGYIYIGGSLFMQSEKGYNLADTINKAITMIFHDKPKFIIGANFGPYSTDSYVDYYRAIFVDYNDICFREQYSKDIFNDLSNIRFCPDVVFQLSLPEICKEEKSVGFSLIDISWRKNLSQYEDNYLQFINQIITESFNDDRSIYLFSFCEKEGDESVISKVISALPIDFRNKINVITYNGNIDEFLNQYAKVESMFSTRFHSMILSSLLDQNIFPIIYSEKMTNVLNDLDYKGVFSKISDLNVENTSECLINIKGSRLKINPSIIDNSKDNFRVFNNMINL
jgi:colanic acid/amylovoran biosynthesis protein